MIEPALFTALIASIGASLLPKTGLPAALRAAIAMAAIAMRADEENGVAMLPATRPLQEHRLMNGRRHRVCAAGWTTAAWLCHVKTSSVWLTSFEVATESGTYRANGWVPTFRLQTRYSVYTPG